MHETGADKFADRPLRRVAGMPVIRKGVEDQRQLVGRQPGRVFFEQECEDDALGLPVLLGRGGGVVRRTTRRF